MLSKIRNSLLIIISLIMVASCNNNAGSTTNNTQNQIQNSLQNTYLAKPNGEYGVGFQDIHWVNKNGGTDPFYNGNNNDDFSQDNQEKHYHEIVARIYYPTNEYGTSPYYAPDIQYFQNAFNSFMQQVPGLITPEQIKEVATLRSYSIPNAAIISNKSYPVLLFSPGYSGTSENYENFITELASHGYIIVAISSPFINLVALPNGHIVQPAQFSSLDDADKRFVPLQTSDLEFVYNQIHVLHDSNPIFSNMDLTRIGAFGHSMGARVVADVTHAHSDWFKAGATLDLMPDKTGASIDKFTVPFMHEISAQRRLAKLTPPDRLHSFILGDNGYLVGISPSEQNFTYSLHDDFSNNSTLGFMPVFQIVYDYDKNHGNQQRGDGNGWNVTYSINSYLIEFFNTYLKNNSRENQLKQCLPLYNTYLKCGPTTVPPIY